MSSAAPSAAVLGATGAIGSALVAELAGRDYRVRAVSRAGTAPAGVEAVAADVASADAVRQACSGCDLVFFAAQPPYQLWAERFPSMTTAVVTGVAAAGAKLVVADNLYLYGPHDGPLVEDLPGAATGKKGVVRAQMARTLLAAHAAGAVRVVIGRLSDYYGPRGIGSQVGERVFDAARLGRPVRMIGRLDQPHTWAYLPDVARTLVALAECEEAEGRAWHLPAAPPLTGAEFVRLVFEAAGTEPRIRSVSRPMLRALGLVSPLLREMPEILYQFERPFVVDDSAYRATIGAFACTPHAEAIAHTSAWFRDRAADRRHTSAADDQSGG